MLLGGGMDSAGSCRFGLADPEFAGAAGAGGGGSCDPHFQANREAGESFRGYVLRHKVETFRKLTADLAKAGGVVSRRIYQDWGDEDAVFTEVGSRECAA